MFQVRRNSKYIATTLLMLRTSIVWALLTYQSCSPTRWCNFVKRFVSVTQNVWISYLVEELPNVDRYDMFVNWLPSLSRESISHTIVANF